MGLESARNYWRGVGAAVAQDNTPWPGEPYRTPLLVRLLWGMDDAVDLSAMPPVAHGRVVPECVDVGEVQARVRSGALPVGQKVQLLVSTPQGRRPRAATECHLLSGPLPEGSLVWADDGLLAPTPELTFVLMGRVLGEAELAAYGCELCGFYALDGSGPLGFASCPQLTSVSRLSEYLARLDELRERDGAGRPWGLARAQRALAHVLDRAASPAEAQVALLLSLPARMGGYGLPKPELNGHVELDEELARTAGAPTLVCDLVWAARRSVLEYAGSVHKAADRVAHDRRKANVLQAAGYDVIEMGSEELMGREAMDAVADTVARSLGASGATRDQDFFDRQLKLRRALLPGPWRAPV